MRKGGTRVDFILAAKESRLRTVRHSLQGHREAAVMATSTTVATTNQIPVYTQNSDSYRALTTILSAFARFERRVKEYERAREILKWGLTKIPRSQSKGLFETYVQLEKQHGDQRGIEQTVLAKRRVQYEAAVKEEPKNYDNWFALIRLEEEAAQEPSDYDRVDEVYERAVAEVPPSDEKRHWRRYIFIWIYWALFTELIRKDMDRTKEIYSECLKLIPHKSFTFAKVWILFAKFLIRQLDLTAARKTMGQAIGMCPKPRLFRGYIDEIEVPLREFDRCRTLYEKWLSYDTSNCDAWCRFARLETELGDLERARAIYDLAANQEQLDMPEVLWKAWIDFEYNQGEFDRTRALYERLLQKTNHVKVWVSFAQLELSVPEGEAEEDEDEDEDEEKPPSEEAIARARKIFQRASNVYKVEQLKDERVLLLDSWASFEESFGDEKSQKAVADMRPRTVKRRRRDAEGNFEEYLDMIFPDDEEESKDKQTFNLLKAAHEWKKRNEEMQKRQREEEASSEDASKKQRLQDDGDEDDEADSAD